VASGAAAQETGAAKTGSVAPAGGASAGSAPAGKTPAEGSPAAGKAAPPPQGATPAPSSTQAAPPTPPESGKKTVTPAPSPTPSAPGAGPAAGPNPALLNPALAKEKAPEKYKAKFSTTKGDFVIEVTRAWSPEGADRFYNLVKIGFFNDAAFFRNVENFMVQFGINGDPAVSTKWRSANIPDDTVQQSNQKGFVTFAKASLPNSRSTQIFINFKDNSFLDKMNFSPFGQVVEGMNVVEALYNEYGDAPPGGSGPNQGRLQAEGNTYLKASFPNLDYIKTSTIVN
jgi:peptidyl-prolyl cis-trans isomerase A (cyclophilin A)